MWWVPISARTGTRIVDHRINLANPPNAITETISIIVTPELSGGSGKTRRRKDDERHDHVGDQSDRKPDTTIHAMMVIEISRFQYKEASDESP